ncbi:hypothetical protein EV426DRAFT_235305 [Tirmania nivea]|nr:hypothetical protein EV426DRAFT_235305 [Tirmania nivea]
MVSARVLVVYLLKFHTTYTFPNDHLSSKTFHCIGKIASRGFVGIISLIKLELRVPISFSSATHVNLMDEQILARQFGAPFNVQPIWASRLPRYLPIRPLMLLPTLVAGQSSRYRPMPLVTSEYCTLAGNSRIRARQFRVCVLRLVSMKLLRAFLHVLAYLGIVDQKLQGARLR